VIFQKFNLLFFIIENRLFGLFIAYPLGRNIICMRRRTMLKKFGLVLVLVSVFAGGVWAQEQNKGLWGTILSKTGFAPGLEGTRFFINGGIGLEAILLSEISHKMPPISVSADYVLPNMPLSLGLKVAVSTLKWETWYGSADLDDAVNFDIGLRTAIHSKILEKINNLDVSALVLIGFDFVTGDDYKLFKDMVGLVGPHGFYIGLGLGGRYFFTKNIGIFLEGDLKFIKTIKLGASTGLALKF
jgi:hypothetical protein